MKEEFSNKNKMNYSQGVPVYEDEISLVDIAKIIVKRRKVFYLVFGVIFGIAFGVSLKTYLGDRADKYVSVYKLAYLTNGLLLEKPETAIEMIESYKEMAIEKLAKEGKTGAEGIDLKIENPKETNIILLTSAVSSSQIELMKELHQNILKSLENSQNTTIKLRRDKLEEESKAKNEGKASVRALEPSVRGAVELGLILEKTQLREGVILQIAQKKAQKVGSGASRTLAVGFAIGFILGLVAIFVVEFIETVKKELKNE